MPEQLAPPQIQPANMDSEPLKLFADQLSQQYALSLVTETFTRYEVFRTNNHDARWNEHDSLYFGAKPPKTWEGTNVARSALGMSIVFEHIETALPQIVQGLFADPQWFQVVPEPGAQIQEAKAIEGVLSYMLDHRDGLAGNATTEITHAAHSTLLYGNGGVYLEWNPEKQMVDVCWCDIRDFYIDSKCVTPNIEDARSVIWRRWMSLEDVDALRKDSRFKIPPRAVLMHMANNPMYASADNTKRTQEALRGVMRTEEYNNFLPLPSGRVIEVLVYYDKGRIIWVFNREWVAYNQKNPYGFYPFCFAPCFPVLGAFYAQSYADVLENIQRYVEALMNAHLDELNLALYPPRAIKAGSNLTPSQQRWRPGMSVQLQNPKEDMVVQFPQGATTNVAQEIEYLETVGQKRTGINTLSMGIPMPSNANRTSSGMGMQLQGTNSRLFYVVKNIEDYLIVPLLFKLYRLTQLHSFPQQFLPALGQDGQIFAASAQSFRAPVRFKMFSASKMLTRDKLAQIVPFLFQNLFQGPFLQGLQSQGTTIDFEVLTEMLQDATGTGARYKFVRPMNQQEMQKMQTPPPQAVMQQQNAQQANQVRMQIAQTKAQSEIQKAQIAKQSDPAEAQAQQQQSQMQMLQAILQMQMEKQKAQNDLASQRQQMILDQQRHQQDMAHKDAQMRQKLITDQLLSHIKAAGAAQQAQSQAAQSQQDLALNAQRGQQDLDMTQQKHEQQLRLQQRLAEMRSRQSQQQKKASQSPANKPKKAA